METAATAWLHLIGHRPPPHEPDHFSTGYTRSWLLTPRWGTRFAFPCQTNAGLFRPTATPPTHASARSMLESTKHTPTTPTPLTSESDASDGGGWRRTQRRRNARLKIDRSSLVLPCPIVINTPGHQRSMMGDETDLSKRLCYRQSS